MSADFRAIEGFLPGIQERLVDPGKLNQAEIEDVLDSFLGLLIERLADNRAVRVPGFGRFTANVKNGRLYFKFVPYRAVKDHLRTALQGRQMMDKYAVVQSSDGNGKTAAAKGNCPEPGCGKPLEKEASVKKCPEHGTKPFEAKEGKDGSRDQA